ncbi:MAG: hypothetical protein ACWA6U_09655 [Breznakibacter sp.]
MQMDTSYQYSNYNSLRDAAIIERDNQKQGRSICEEPDEAMIMAFDERFGTCGIQTIDDLMINLF